MYQVFSQIPSSVHFVVIDEAHLYLRWGSFRPAMQHIPRLPNAVVVAMTATLRQRDDTALQTVLNMQSPHVERQSILQYQHHHTVHVRKSVNFADVLREQQQLLVKNKAIIFVNAKSKMAEYLAEARKLELAAAVVHGDMDAVTKDQVAADLRSGQVRLVIATDAFALGVDIRDISVIILFDLPADLEDLVQRIGRGGRNGERVQCVTYVRQHDWSQLVWRSTATTSDQDAQQRLFSGFAEIRRYVSVEKQCRSSY